MSAFVRGSKSPASVIAVCAVVLLLGACSSGRDAETAAVDSGASAPAGAVPGSAEDFANSAPDRVFFALDQHDLDEADRQILMRQAAWLSQNARAMVTVEGHCDERGSREYNMELGALRANEVKNFLVQQGVDPDRITTVSYGKERPADPRASEDAWRMNRRGVTIIKAVSAW